MKLSEYAALRRCPVCVLPVEVRQELKENFDAGERYSIMVRWLREFHNVNILSEKIKNHFNNRHYERDAEP